MIFFKKYKKTAIVSIVIICLIVIRLILPTIVLRYANKALANIDGYYGHVDDIGLSIYRGAYQINDIYINKVDSATKEQTHFFTSKNVNLSIEWLPLFHGKLVGKLVFNSPQLIFTKNKTEIGKVAKDTNDFRKILKSFMPLKVNHFEVNNGSIHYVDGTTNPKVDIFLTDAHIVAQNLTNVVNKEQELPSAVTATANIYSGTLSLDMKLDGLAINPTFDLNAEIKNTNLVLLNDFLQAYGSVDVNRGTFGLYTEFASKDGKYKGYVKPIIHDLKVLGPKDKKDDLLHLAWEALVGGVADVFKNQGKDQLATKVPIEGDTKTAQTNIPETVWELLRNAFIQALVPTIDNQININSVNNSQPDKKPTILQKVFSKKKGTHQ
ncbi:MAG TPA: DUF748 domain-containing protein [Ferruginibacter sp.]|jgi:hypothetical protein|nr:DUF748 domain-containing protein [Ferruginibacter sp.]